LSAITCRIARIVLRMPASTLPTEVGADVGALREDAAAESREDRDQRGAEREAEHRLQDRRQRAVRRDVAVAGDEHEEDADAEQAEADDQHAGDRAALERDVQRRADAERRGLRRAHVGAHRDVHADEAAGARQHRAEDEADLPVVLSRKIPIRIVSTMPTMPIVLYWRAR
jgi:hypothetical protein